MRMSRLALISAATMGAISCGDGFGSVASWKPKASFFKKTPKTQEDFRRVYLAEAKRQKRCYRNLKNQTLKQN